MVRYSKIIDFVFLAYQLLPDVVKGSQLSFRVLKVNPLTSDRASA
jgi:hypothetical protein